jgi:tetratricopeptide (TPR) repeat protein
MTSPERPAAAPTAAPPAAGEPSHLSDHVRATMPPPGRAVEGTDAVGATGPAPRPRPTLTPPAVPRRVGARAEEAAMRARVEEARTLRDERAERDASVQLARWLAARERDLDQAAELGRRALALREDPELRRELAAWLESLGDPAGASAMLASLAASLAGDGQQAARVQSRIGALEARAGNAEAASRALERAAQLDPSDALAWELRAALTGWAPAVVSAAAAAHAYVEAAARRAEMGAPDAQMEDLLRAFEADPESEVAAASLAASLVARERAGSADEVLRLHAVAVGAEDAARGAHIHSRRRADALAKDDLPRALGAALDERLDAELEGPGADALDGLLLRAGMHEALAVRLELRAELARSPERARMLEELGRLYAGPLASPERAVDAFLRAVAAEPTRTESLVALRAHAASKRDPGPLMEGLVRAVGTPPLPGEKWSDRQRAARVVCARALAQLADEQLSDPALAAWAMERLAWLDPDDPQPRTALARSAGRLAAHQEKVDAAQRDLIASTPDGRVAALRTLAALLRGMPEQADARARALGELVAKVPPDRALVGDAYRLAWRRGQVGEVVALAQRQLEGSTETATRVEARRQLAAAARAMGEVDRANEAARPLLEEAPGHRGAAALVWVHAALAGDARTRALAIERVAASSAPAMRATLLGLAAAALDAVGDPAGARRLAEEGFAVDPASARCITALADAALGASDTGAALALERGIEVVLPRSTWCATLADALERSGEPVDAVSWTQRYVALRPSDAAAIEALIGRVVRARDGARLAEALAWTLSQPQPTASLAEHVAPALRELVVLDTERAVVIARRALDVFGPRHEALRAAMAEVAGSASDDGFAAALVERWIAAGAPPSERGDLHVELASLRERMGDHEGEARAVLRAIKEGVDPRALETHIGGLTGVALSPDAELAWIESRAALMMLGGDKGAAARAFRELGAAVWDLTLDRASACRAWVRAAALAPSRGYETLAADLELFGDPAFVLGVLGDLLDKEGEGPRAASIAAEMARAALHVGDPGQAFELSARALFLDPTMADALESAERGSVGCGREAEMSELYDVVGSRALGRFGRRAAHYRGARFFERRGQPPLALRHAAEAFTAVPSQGATLVLLSRTADAAGDRSAAMRAIERAADAASGNAARAAWLLRAASAAGDDEDGLRHRVDLLLRAALLVPDAATVRLLAGAATALVRLAPDERDTLHMRVVRASAKVTANVSGPDGARVAVAVALLVLDLFEDAQAGFDALERAIAIDGSIDEFTSLAPLAARLAQGDGSRASLARAMAMCEAPYASVGAPALELLAAVAEACGDRASQARAVVLAAVRAPDDDAIVLAGDAAAHASEDPALRARLDAGVPPARRVAALRAFAAEQMARGTPDAAIEALERAVELAAPSDLPAIDAELRRACAVGGHGAMAEARRLRDASDPRLTQAERADRWTAVAEDRERGGDLPGAASALLEAAVLDATSIDRWSTLERVAAMAGRGDLRIDALNEIASRVPESSRVDVLRRLARAHEDRDDADRAEATWQEIWALDPDDGDADCAIESLITRRADYTALAEHLSRRAERLAALGDRREALRALRLRRAAILEQRLNRAKDACDELSLLLTESPDNESALCYLADLHERLGEFDRAAPLWRRVAGLTRDADRQCELAIRAARASVSGGDLTAAMGQARSVAAEHPGNREAIDLRIELAREMNDERELGDALDDLATTAIDDVATRSDTLLEAAEAAARAGEIPSSISRAQRAARIAPTRAAAQLYARGLEYRLRGSGSPDDAKQTVAELGKIQGQLVPDDAALQAFLLAEALDALEGRGAGMQKLLARQTEIGAHPLLAVGIAERLVSQWKFQDALPHFHEALRGNLLGLRKRGAVALSAADAATRCDRPEMAVRFLEEAASDGAFRGAALRRVAQLALASGDLPRSRAALLELAREAVGEDRARTLAQLARILYGSQETADRDEAERVFEEAIAAAPEDGLLRAQLEMEHDALTSSPS